MGKDGALGHDPLRWMKITKANNKSLSPEDANPGIQSAPKQQIPLPSGNGEGRLVSKKVAPSPVSVNIPNNPAAPKSKVVIGRLYEKPSPEKIKSVQRNENEIQEASRSVEPSFAAPRTIPPIKRTETETNRIPVSATANHFSAYIIVAYTALLLILGYFVYGDLSKRMCRIEAKIVAIEKTLREK